MASKAQQEHGVQWLELQHDHLITKEAYFNTRKALADFELILVRKSSVQEITKHTDRYKGENSPIVQPNQIPPTFTSGNPIIDYQQRQIEAIIARLSELEDKVSKITAPIIEVEPRQRTDANGKREYTQEERTAIGQRLRAGRAAKLGLTVTQLNRLKLRPGQTPTEAQLSAVKNR